jgi:hypothetical protein
LKLLRGKLREKFRPGELAKEAVGGALTHGVESVVSPDLGEAKSETPGLDLLIASIPYAGDLLSPTQAGSEFEVQLSACNRQAARMTAVSGTAYGCNASNPRQQVSRDRRPEDAAPADATSVREQAQACSQNPKPVSCNK